MKFLELLEDEALANELLESLDDADLESEEECIEFISNEVKKHGVKVTEEEIQSFLDKQPLSDDELDQVSGGAAQKFAIDGGQNPIAFAKLTSKIKSKGRARERSRSRIRVI